MPGVLQEQDSWLRVDPQTCLPLTLTSRGPAGSVPSERMNCAAVTWGDFWYIHGGYSVRYGGSGDLEQGDAKTSM